MRRDQRSRIVMVSVGHLARARGYSLNLAFPLFVTRERANFQDAHIFGGDRVARFMVRTGRGRRSRAPFLQS